MAFFNSIKETMDFLKTVLSTKEYKSISVVAKKKILDGTPYTIRYINVHNDDSLYKKSEIWKHVPRGFFELVDIDEKIIYVGVGMRKFVYTSTKGMKHALPIGKIRNVVAMEKENGECGHAGAFMINGKLFWIICSKHVPIIYEHGKLVEYIAQYEDKYSTTALKIAKIWDKGLAKLNAHALHEYMTLDGYMFNFEAIVEGSEHFVTYDEVDIVICFSITKHSPYESGLTAVDPISAVEIFKMYGLRTASISPVFEYGSKDWDLYLCEVTAKRGSEGVVVYGMSDESLVCVFKHKAILYDLERQIREAISRGEYLSDLMSRITKYSSFCSPEELVIVRKWIEDRLPQLISFYKWLIHSKVIKIGIVLENDDNWNFRSRYLTLQKNFELSPIEDKESSNGIVLDRSGNKKKL